MGSKDPDVLPMLRLLSDIRSLHCECVAGTSVAPMSLYIALRRFARLNCRERRDCVYALINVAASKDQVTIRVDYAITPCKLAVAVLESCAGYEQVDMLKLVHLLRSIRVISRSHDDVQHLLQLRRREPDRYLERKSEINVHGPGDRHAGHHLEKGRGRTVRAGVCKIVVDHPDLRKLER